MTILQEDSLSKLLIFLTVWCSCWSKVSRQEPETDFSEIRIRHHKNRGQNMTHHHHNATSDKDQRHNGYIYVGEQTEKDMKETTVAEPTINAFDNLTESFPVDEPYGYWPEPGTAFPW